MYGSTIFPRLAKTKADFTGVNIINIDIQKCKSCGACVRECPLNQSGVRVDPTDKRCDDCFHCYAICPNNAIWLDDSNGLECRYQNDITLIEANELENFFAYRRSVRHFAQKDIPHAIVKKILGAARYIPSGGNRHAHEFTIIQDPFVRKQLKAEVIRFYKKKAGLLKNPVVRFIGRRFGDKMTQALLKDPVYFKKIVNQLDKLFDESRDSIFYDSPLVLIIHSDKVVPTVSEDSFLAGYNAILMAQALGIGSCFVSAAQIAISSSKKCKEIIGLPWGHDVYSVVVFGYPKIRFQRSAPRIPRPVTWL